jgi:hypothetical protein
MYRVFYDILFYFVDYGIVVKIYTMKAKYWYSIEKLNKTMNLNEDIFTVNQNKFGFILNKTLHKKY